MQIYADKLAAHLNKTLARVYLVCGDDNLLRDDAALAIVSSARQAGYSDHQKFIHEDSGIWAQLLEAASAMSLFAEQRLLELKLTSAKIGAEGSQALLECLQHLGDDSVLLIQSPRVEGKPKWLKAIIDEGVYVPIYPLDSNQLPGWLIQRSRQTGLQLERDAAQLLAERVEGNLVTAVQELEKLALLCDDGQAVSAELVDSSVVDNARFSAFNMIDKAIDGDAKGSSRALAALREEGSESIAINGALSYQLNLLYELAAYANSNQLPQQIKSKRILPRRQSAVASAIKRLGQKQLARCLQLLSYADRLYKNGEQELCWITQECVLLNLAGQPQLAERQLTLLKETPLT